MKLGSERNGGSPSIWKAPQMVVTCFGAARRDARSFLSIRCCSAEQVGYILRDCNVRALVTSPERIALLTSELSITVPICGTSC